MKSVSLGAILALFIASPCIADDALPDAKLVPELQALPLPHQQVSLQRNGEELTRFHFDPDDRRPFWYPIQSSVGRSLSRMGHPHDPVTHSHHNSVWISHHDLGGIDFWGDHGKGKGRIVHQRVLELWDSDGSSGVLTLNHWIPDGSDAPLLVERRQSEIVPGADGSWYLIVDLEFTVPKGGGPVKFNQTPFGLIGVRMAKSIGVHDGGGRILNSAGAVNEEAVFRKPASWVDYSGKITNQQPAGITLMDHPQNPGFPSPFHVRGDGWMGICLTLEHAIEVTVEKPLSRRYALWVHDGIPDVAQADKAFEIFAKRPKRKSSKGK